METISFSYDCGKEIVEKKSHSDDIINSLNKMSIDTKSGSAFTKYFRDELTDKGWDHKGKVKKKLGMRFGLRKNRLQIEPQFSNVARYYSDIFKLQLAYNEDDIDAGILIVPTKQHANQLGSNLAYFERAKEELVESKPMYTVPIWVIGVKMSI
ncbi:MAG: BglII/BstYI family type II restriction endonuclease [Candidatus Paceibacteria bacterium]